MLIAPARTPWILVLGLNLLWFALLPSRPGKTVALAGSIVAAIILVAPRASARLRAWMNGGVPAPGGALARVVMIGLFMLPALSFLATPRIAFWVIDSRAWLILAWLCTATALLLAPANDDATSQRLLSPKTVLFLIWVSSFWLMVIADVGVARFVLHVDRGLQSGCRYDPLAVTFSTWESSPARVHRFLAWRTPEGIRDLTPYAQLAPAFLFTMYAWVRAVRDVGGVAMYVATNTTPFLCMFLVIAAATALFARTRLLAAVATPDGLMRVFLAYGFLITMWRFWNDLLRYTTDNPYPLAAAALVWLYTCLLDPVPRRWAMLSAAIFAALEPIYVPIVLLAVVCLFGHAAPTARELLARNQNLVTLAVAAILVGAVTYAAPVLAVKYGGYTAWGHRFLFRSGLDGDTTYFSNMLQAVFAPCPVKCCWGRTTTDLLFPTIVPLSVWGAVRWRVSPSGALRLGHMLGFLATPYLVSVILFPQSVSIHPYMYDNFVLIPVAVAGAAALLDVRSKQFPDGSTLALLLVMGAVIMWNLVGLAQGLHQQ